MNIHEMAHGIHKGMSLEEVFVALGTMLGVMPTPSILNGGYEIRLRMAPCFGLDVSLEVSTRSGHKPNGKVHRWIHTEINHSSEVDIRPGETIVLTKTGRVDYIFQVKALVKVDREFLQVQPALVAKLREALTQWGEQFSHDRSMYDVGDRIKEALAMLEGIQ